MLSVPHAGSDYPDWLLSRSVRGIGALRALEDPRVDELAERALDLGTAAVIARAPRAIIDCNRSPLELDTLSVSGLASDEPGPRARGGLGIIPSRTLRDGHLWQRPLGREEYQHRLDTAYEPYHRAIATTLNAIWTEHGSAILIDCHSMPARPVAEPRIIIGDRHGRAAASWVREQVAATCRRLGYSTSANVPYAGGWIIERHGDPMRNIHAVQLELDRSCYLAPDGFSRGAGFDRAANMLELVTRTLGEQLLTLTMRDAAE